MKKRMAGLLFAGLLAACNNAVESNAGNTAIREDTVQEAEADADVVMVQQAFPEVFAYLKKQDSTFSEEHFLPSGIAEIEPAPLLPVDDAQLAPYRKYLIYNSDSSRALDLYSYNHIIVSRNGENKMEEGSPDSEAALIDFNAKTRRRIFFGGPSFGLWDGKWNGTNMVLMIGAETGSEIKMTPAIWQINLTDTVIHVYEYQGTIKADMNGYQKNK